MHNLFLRAFLLNIYAKQMHKAMHTKILSGKQTIDMCVKEMMRLQQYSIEILTLT